MRDCPSFRFKLFLPLVFVLSLAPAARAMGTAACGDLGEPACVHVTQPSHCITVCFLWILCPVASATECVDQGSVHYTCNGSSLSIVDGKCECAAGHIPDGTGRLCEATPAPLQTIGGTLKWAGTGDPIRSARVSLMTYFGGPGQEIHLPVIDPETGVFETSTDQDGAFTFTLPPVYSSAQLELKVELENDHVRFKKDCPTGEVFDAVVDVPLSSESSDIEVSFAGVPASRLRTIWEALADAIAFHRQHAAEEPSFTEVCADPTALFYRPREHQIHFKPDAAHLRDSVIHEYGHKAMSDLMGAMNFKNLARSYEDSCQMHTIGKKTGPVCAWAEGWAHFFAMQVNARSTFRDVPLEAYCPDHQSPDNKGWDEGWVAAALLDLVDSDVDGNCGAAGFADVNGTESHPVLSIESLLQVLQTARQWSQPINNMKQFYRLLRTAHIEENDRAIHDAIVRYNHIFSPSATIRPLCYDNFGGVVSDC